MIKALILGKDITIVLIIVFAPKQENLKQILTHMKVETNSNTVIAGDSNTTLTSMEKSSRQKINKNTLTLNDTLDLMDL